MGVLQVPITFVVFVYLLASMKILNEHERGIILRLGRLIAHPKGPGLILVFRPIDRMFRVKAADLVRGQPITLMDGLKVRLVTRWSWLDSAHTVSNEERNTSSGA